MIVPVVVAGGKGTRLWPASREVLPKPYAAGLSGDNTLLQATLHRINQIANCSRPLVVCASAHDFLVQQQASTPDGCAADLLLEPEGRNTAPAICAAALAVARRHGPDVAMLVLPADHVIRKGEAFAEAVARAADLAHRGYLTTFAITPTHAATGYGYLRIGEAIDEAQQQFKLAGFVEKPDHDRAAQFLASGSYAWNSGMFVFQPGVILDAFERLQPEILSACLSALPDESSGPVMRLGAEAFAAAPSISIDYAIMEKSADVATVVADLGWSDVGDWQAIWELSDRDTDGNACQGAAEAVASQGCLIRSDGPLVVGVGLTDIIAVGTKDAVVVAPRSKAQEVKRAVDHLTALGRSEATIGIKVLRPWGSYEQLHIGPGFQVKELTVRPGAKLSLQRHKHRAEHWVCIAGEGIATRGDERIPLSVDQTVYIPLGAIHRLENPGHETLRVIEVQLGSYTGEDDIERLEDIYGRA
ncbi:MAG: mannose-1-phosphate guanylyltransferase/mannose-6-phosphate isomerase [Alphaproteobacteria bacterium]|nr:mannose-1-phosphate guanylyltransferase/mannose-6-phosphate isomerase [Alphaproteobacteria bacterium]